MCGSSGCLLKTEHIHSACCAVAAHGYMHAVRLSQHGLEKFHGKTSWARQLALYGLILVHAAWFCPKHTDLQGHVQMETVRRARRWSLQPTINATHDVYCMPTCNCSEWTSSTLRSAEEFNPPRHERERKAQSVKCLMTLGVERA